MQQGLWGRSAIYGVALWIIAFLVIALLSSLGIAGQTPIGGGLLLLVALLVTWTLAARLSFVSISQGLGVGALWVLTNIILDSLVIVLAFSGGNPAFFFLWVVWGRYLLLGVIPVVLASRRRSA